MKQILFLIFLCLTTHSTASGKNKNLTDLLHSFGDNGEYEQMDSIYQLITRESHYQQDKLYALNTDLDYARFLNQKGDWEKAYPLLIQTRQNATALGNRPGNSSLHSQFQGIGALATYEIASDSGRPTSFRKPERRPPKPYRCWNN